MKELDRHLCAEAMPALLLRCPGTARQRRHISDSDQYSVVQKAGLHWSVSGSAYASDPGATSWQLSQNRPVRQQATAFT